MIEILNNYVKLERQVLKKVNFAKKVEYNILLNDYIRKHNLKIVDNLQSMESKAKFIIFFKIIKL